MAAGPRACLGGSGGPWRAGGGPSAPPGPPASRSAPHAPPRPPRWASDPAYEGEQGVRQWLCRLWCVAWVALWEGMGEEPSVNVPASRLGFWGGERVGLSPPPSPLHDE